MKTILFAVLLAVTAGAQTYTNGPLIEVSSANLFTNCTADDIGSQNGLLFPNTEVEPWIVVNPINTSNVVGIWQQDRWSDGGARGLVAGVSFDAGLTWEPVAIPGLTACSGDTFQRASDPWLSFAPDGTLHALGLAFDEDLPTGGFNHNAILTSRSVDGGLNWSATVTLIETNDVNVLNDKESITADPTDPNLVYAVWDRLQPFKNPAADFTGPTLFTRSTDGGATWEPARVLNKPGKFKQTLGNQIVVQPDGTLINVSTFISALKVGKARCAIAVQRSFDHGVTWEKNLKRVIKTQPISAFNPNGVTDPQSHQSLRTGDVIPAVAVDPVTGTIYAAWQDSRFSANGFDEIAFAQSLDGRKWSKPVKVNLTPAQGPGPNRQAFNPSIRVAADSTICVNYSDFRNNDPDPELWTDVWAVFCKPTLAAPATVSTNWGNEVRLTDESFDFLQAPNARGFFLGDYEGLAAAGNDFLAFWSQPQDLDRANIVFRRLMPAP
jgi:hypothetical protein